jgi:hypothetical protein
MIHRFALFAASLAAALVIAGGLALAGLGPQQPATGVALVADAVADPASAAAPAAPEPIVQVDTVYLTPPVAPQEITVTKVKVVSRHHGESDDHEGGEGGDD